MNNSVVVQVFFKHGQGINLILNPHEAEDLLARWRSGLERGVLALAGGRTVDGAAWSLNLGDVAGMVVLPPQLVQQPQQPVKSWYPGMSGNN